MTDSGGLYVHQRRQYKIYSNGKGVEKLTRRSKKHGYYSRARETYPFLQPEYFFEQLLKRKFAFQKVRDGYLVMDLEHTIQFDGQLRIKEITRHGYNELTKEKFFNRTRFDYRDEDSLGTILKLVSLETFSINPLNRYVQNESKNPSHISIDTLLTYAGAYVNEAYNHRPGKLLFIHFFFQGCYPCVLSYPGIKTLKAEVGDKMDFIAIDAVLSDSATALQYAKKYQMNYPVLVGKMAKRINDHANVGVWPTFLILNDQGKIIKRKNGYSKSFFRKVKRITRRT